MEERFGTTVEEARLLRGAVVRAFEPDGDTCRVELELTDGRTLSGRLSPQEYHELAFGGIPLLTDTVIV